MKLKIAHYTQYDYEDSVVDSVNELRLTPIIDDYQKYFNHSIKIYPSAPIHSYTDYFGNLTHYFTLNAAHKRLLIKMDATVETDERTDQVQQRRPYVEELDLLHSDAFQNQFAEYLMETDYTIITSELEDIAYSIVLERQPTCTYELLELITKAIYKHFTYDTDATNVHTTLEETIHLKRGVCQDYAHLMIGICRIFKIPTRYISGYHFLGEIGTESAHLQHASHAWIEAYIPFVGWIGFDPTNDGKIDWRYVKLSHGRDYSDITPVKGVYKGTAQQQLNVTVDVQYMRE